MPARRLARTTAHYHTLQHLEECLALFDELRDQAQHPLEVELALWFHDAVYDLRAHDNEACSARWAEAALTTAGLPPQSIRRIRDLIMATCHGASPASSANPDTALLTDIDLAILGAPTARFADHERRIRAEYAWVAPEVFAVKDARCCAVSSSALRSVPCRSCTSAWHTTTCAAPRQIANPACQNRINSSPLSLQ